MKVDRSLLLFSAVALSFALISYFNNPILTALSHLRAGPGERHVIQSFESVSQKPIILPDISGMGDPYVDIKFSFSPTSLNGFPNIAQTADVNSGVRFELHGHLLSIVYPGPGGVTGHILSDDIRVGQWYTVEAAFQSKGSIRALCSGGEQFESNAIAGVMVNKILVGRGFTDERKFQGQIENFSIRSSPSLGMAASEWVLLAFKLILFCVAAAAVWRMAHSKSRDSSSTVGQIDVPAVQAVDPLLTLRTFALLQVLIGHLFMCVFVPDGFKDRLLADPWFCLMTPSPWAGVWVFFTLSGYLMGKGFYSGRYSCEPSKVYRFLSSRALRIVPIYWVAVILVSAVACPEIAEPKHLSVLASILMFDYNGQQRLNPIGALWSVSTEVQFYALVPILFWMLSPLTERHKDRAFYITGALLAVGLATRVLVRRIVHNDGVYTYVYAPFLGNFDLFVVGMLANPVIAALRSKGVSVGLASGKGIVLLICGGYVLSSVIGARVITGSLSLPQLMIYGPTAAAMLTLIIIVWCEMSARETFCQGTVRRVLVLGNAIGVLTYPIYVWHEPILLGVRRLAPSPLAMGDAIKYAAMASILVWAVAELVYRYIELPFDAIKRKSQRKESVVANDIAPSVVAHSTVQHPQRTSKAA